MVRGKRILLPLQDLPQPSLGGRGERAPLSLLFYDCILGMSAFLLPLKQKQAELTKVELSVSRGGGCVPCPHGSLFRLMHPHRFHVIPALSLLFFQFYVLSTCKVTLFFETIAFFRLFSSRLAEKCAGKTRMPLSTDSMNILFAPFFLPEV